MIDGVIIRPLKKIPDERGAIFHMVRNDDVDFISFGEIYFSCVYPQMIKAWHLHSEMVLNYAVIKGMIKLVLFDGRAESKTKGELMEIFIGDQNYVLVQIPIGVWNGFKGVGSDMAIVANCATLPHSKSEIKRMDPHDNSIISYDWSAREE